MIRINSNLILPDDEIRFTFSKSGGPGGQNVNKLNTRVTLWFDVTGSATLSDQQKETITLRLGNRINSEGLLQIVSVESRSQLANRENAVQRFINLLAGALHEQARRKKTKIPRRAKESRLKSKKLKSRIKSGRSRKSWDE